MAQGQHARTKSGSDDRRPGKHRKAPDRPSLAAPALVGTAAVAFAAASGLALADAHKLEFRHRKVRAESDTTALSALELAQLRADRESKLRASREQARVALDEKRRRDEAERRKRAEAERRRREAERKRPEVAERIAVAALKADADACDVRLSTQREETLDDTQWRNARIIVDVARRVGLPPRAAVIAVATARQESDLRNLTYGHLDSIGLFQQRPSMGWGTVSQILDPYYAARKFYAGLVQVPDWERLPLSTAAQAVQRSAYPSAYAQWELLATRTVARIAVLDAGELTCRA